MDDILKVLLDKQPVWFFQASSVVLLIILIIVAIWVFKGAKRYSDGIDKENRLVGLLDERNILQQEKDTHKAITDQLSVVLENGTNFVKALNEYNSTSTSVNIFIQSIIESMATDIKTVVGERHRCGFWNPDENEEFLKLGYGSSSFPPGYAHQRQLSINHSIAGRCYRKREILFINDVTQDPDWTISDNPSSYTSLICVPVSNWGVITIDAKQNMNDNTVLIGKFYSSIIEGFLNRYALDQLSNLASAHSSAESAAGIS
ncbi:GAF domain-containing protein [Peribacillus simplex]